MTGKYTPGPWSYFEPAEADQFLRGFDEPGVRAWRIFSRDPSKPKGPGCQCVGTLVPGHFNDRGPTEADARLIAAAPLLLEALEAREILEGPGPIMERVAAIHGAGLGWDSSTYPGEMDMAAAAKHWVREKSRAALATARGEVKS